MPLMNQAKLTLLVCWIAVLSVFVEERPAADEWRPLPLVKNGKVHPDWLHLGWGGFAVEDDGSLRTECVPEGMGLLLYQKQPFGNCQIRIVYRPEKPKSNAGVYVRIDPEILTSGKGKQRPAAVRREPDGALAEDSLQKLMDASQNETGPWYAVHHGYEVQICDEAEAFHRTGAIYSLAKAEALPETASGNWRRMIITLRDNLVQVEIDGKPVTTFESNDTSVPSHRVWYEPKRDVKRPTVGYIGLQNHDPGDIVYFKEVSVRPLAGD